VPELPEVEAARRQIERWTAGKRLSAVRVLDPAVVRTKVSTLPSDRLADGDTRLEALVGRRSGAVRRHGKRLGWELGRDGLLIHFGMTGFFVLRPAKDEPPPLARAGFGFGRNTLWFVDGRRFGCVVPIGADELDLALRSGQGPDAGEPLDGVRLRAALTTRRELKIALMDQGRVAGLGNIHAAEACFRAGIGPFRSALSLADEEWDHLAAAIHDQLRDASEELARAEEVQYVNLGGPNPFRVYGRAEEPCPTCGAPICAADQGGRTTYWCAVCQPA
jgi:formamidopyrimidine-DNA glycosylase